MEKTCRRLPMNVFVLILVQGYLYNAASGVSPKCPDLAPGSNQIVSNTEAYLGESVQVSCKPGFALDVGALTKEVLCINNASIPMWNESLGACTPKACNAVPLGENMTVTVGSAPFLIGDNVTVTCDTGHAFSVNLALNVTDRVVASQTLTCLDDPASTEGQWSEMTDNCSLIECRAPTAIANSIMDYTNITYGATIVYRCYSGQKLSGRYTWVATCTQNAEWEIPGHDLESGYLYCGNVDEYAGCVPSPALSVQDSYTAATLNADDCFNYCQSKSYRFAAVYADTCTCSNGLADDYDVFDDEMCNITCAGNDGTDQYQSVFCGGTGPLSSVYVTVDGCFENITVDMSDSEEVVADEKFTCKERCRTRDFSHAAIFNTTCFCMNTSQVDGVKVDRSYCDKSETAQYLNVQDLAKTKVTAENCSELFDSGIRMHGSYMLKDATKIYCNFKDGTICDDGWIGYHGDCYLFHIDQKMNFTNARDFCLGQEAELVSILSKKEAGFMRNTRKSFSDLQEKSWYVGMIDSHNVSLFSWLDGNLFSYSRFATGQPSGLGLCVRDAFSSFMWYSVRCSTLHYPVCKKTESIHKCASVNITDADYTRTEPTMTLPFCVEICRGQNANYSAVSGTYCHCFPSVPTGTEYTLRRQCNTPCPGDPYQYCGNAENYTLIEVPGRRPAQSCEDLQLVGIGNGSFAIQKERDTTLQDCATPECPYAWLEIRGRCYRFNPDKTSSAAARKYCSIYDAYPVVLETVQETEELMNTVSNLSVYNATRLWRIGLQSLSLSSGLYRWANGKMPPNSLWSNDFMTHDGVEVLVPKDNYTEWMAREVGEYAFMCEKGRDILDYLGCYNATGLVWDYNTTEFDQMTIQQCVEWCRSGSRIYAFVSSSLCACSDTLTQHAAAGAYCYNRCSGQQNQVCGGEGLMSVYNISEYEPIASQCSNLTDASIFLSGTYEVGGGTQHCDLTDTTVCDTTWLGYNTDCYKYDPELLKSNHDWWYDNDVVMTSVTTANEEQFLKDYLQRLFLGYNPGRIITGLKDTYQLRIYSQQDGLLFKPYTLSSKYPTSQNFTLYVGFETKGFGLSLHGEELGFIAKKDRHKFGCFEIPSWLTPVLSNFSSMELTLCKQLCLATDAEVVLMTLDSCYCGNASLTALLTPSVDDKCKNPCQVHPLQWCGHLGSAITYRVAEDEAHIAIDCDSLYLSGVFYNTTYKLWNGTTSRLETCGFTDNTACPATWFGKEGQCYKLFILPKTFDIARSECFHSDSYLFNPTKASTVWSILEYINNIPILNDTGLLISGIRTIFFNVTYVTSDGTRLTLEDSPTIDTNAVPQNYVKASVVDIALKDYNPDGELPFICQKDGDYLGCSRIQTPSVTNISNVIDISLTMCREYCRGQDTTYFATSDTSCHCYATVPSYTTEEGQCDTPCRGADTQPCGGVDNGTSLYSLFRIANKTSLASSCVELARYGIRHPGEYYIEPGPTVGSIKVTCFRQPSPITSIASGSYKQLTVSSTLSDFDPTKTFNEYSLHEVWKPKTNDVNQNVKLSLDGIHIVTGVILSGILTHSDMSWVTKTKITYRDPLSGTLVDCKTNGTNQIETNSNGIDQSYIFFSQPFVTEEVIISPLEWHTSIALKAYLLGQLYKDFSHEDFYIGCVLDYSDMFKYFGTGALCDDTSGCAALGDSFMALDGNGTCYCGSGNLGFQYGFVDGHCILNGTKYVGEGSLFKALYRTYEKKCLTPTNITDGQIFNITYPYVNNVYTYGAATKYVCDVGYEFDDGSSDVTTACRQDNMWDNITQSCHIISCPSFNVTNGAVDIYSLEYLGEAHVMCDNSHWADNGEQNVTVTCQADKNWNIMPTCKENNLKENVRFFSSYARKKRDPVTMTVESVARSSLECTVKCTTAYYCKGANFKKLSADKGTCRLFVEYADPTHLTVNVNWKYFETYDMP